MEKTKTRKLGLKSLNTMMYEEGIVDSDLLASLFTLSNEEFILTDKNFNIQTRNFKVFINKSDKVGEEDIAYQLSISINSDIVTAIEVHVVDLSIGDFRVVILIRDCIEINNLSPNNNGSFKFL